MRRNICYHITLSKKKNARFEHKCFIFSASIYSSSISKIIWNRNRNATVFLKVYITLNICIRTIIYLHIWNTGSINQLFSWPVYLTIFNINSIRYLRIERTVVSNCNKMYIISYFSFNFCFVLLKNHISLWKQKPT